MLLSKNKSLNILQLMKFGIHVGGKLSQLHAANKALLAGQRKKIAFVDLNHNLASSRRVCFLLRKMLAKRQTLFCPGFPKHSVLNRSLYSHYGNNRNGFLSNREFNRKKLKNRLRIRYLRQRLSKKILLVHKTKAYRRVTKSLPALLLLPRQKGFYFSLLESRKKKMLSAMFVDTSEQASLAQYPVLGNNRSASSLQYFYKLLELSFIRSP